MGPNVYTGPYHLDVVIKNSKLGGFTPSELFYNDNPSNRPSTLRRTVDLINCTDLAGNPLYYPSVTEQDYLGRNVHYRNVDFRNSGNPLNKVEPIVIESGSSTNGNNTYIIPLDSLGLNLNRVQYPWRMGDSAQPVIDTGSSFTLIFYMVQSGRPEMAPLEMDNSRLLHIDIEGGILHTDAFEASSTTYEDRATIKYDSSGLVLVQNFTETRGSTNYRVLEIVATRATTQGSANGTPNEPVPTALSEWVNLHRIEVDIAVTVTKTDGRLIPLIAGAVQWLK